MKNIVTIDFDIIMAPSIGVYNDEVDPDYPVSEYIKNYPFLDNGNLPANFYIYEYLTRYIIRTIKKTKNIHFIEDHSEICDIIKTYPKDEYKITNIDHHHDVGYDIIFNKLLVKPECGNWVKWLKDNKYISSYSWIRDENSEKDLEDDLKKYIDEIIEFEVSKLEKLAAETDILVICASYEWVPPAYHGLFLTWQTIYEEMKND